MTAWLPFRLTRCSSKPSEVSLPSSASLPLLRRYDAAREALTGCLLDQIPRRRQQLEKRIKCFRTLAAARDKQSHAIPVPDPRCEPLADECSRVLRGLVSVLSQVCDRSSNHAEVDLVKLATEVSTRVAVVPRIVKRLLFTDVDQFLTDLALEDSREKEEREQLRVKSVLLLMATRLEAVEARMCKFVHSMEKRKGCWIREVSRLLAEVEGKGCRLPVCWKEVQRSELDFREVDRLLERMQLDPSLTTDDELDITLRQLEQKIRRVS